MKKMLFLSLSLFLLLLTGLVSAQPIVTQNLGLPLANSTHTVWGDYDNDGDLDLLYSGFQTGTGTSLTYLYKNNNGSFVNSGASLQTIATGVPNVLDFGDVNNDGWLDILVCGNGKSGLYLNNQGAGFSSYSVSIDTYTDAYGGFYDLNNDGKLDILIGAFVWINNGSMSFTRKSSGIPYYQFNNLDVADYDFDGFPDVALIGNGSFEIYKNDGTGSFSAIGVGVPGLTHYNLGAGMYAIPGVKWGDYDQDGDPDFMIYGFNSISNQMETLLYENQGFGTFVFHDSYLPYIGCSNAWVDVNFDGYPDVVGSGLNYDLTTTLTKISINNGSGKFADSGLNLASTTNAWVSVADYQQDRDPDILMTGNSLSRLFRNDNTNKNTPPAYPSTFKIKEVGNQTHFYWDAGSDSETQTAALTYNLRIGTASNPNQVRPADSNPSTGFIKTVKPGNMGSQTELYLSDLQPGETYVASVQTLDNNFLGSDWFPEITYTLVPAMPVVTEPTDVTENSFVINWTASYGATSYQVFVAEDASFNLPLSGYNPSIVTENHVQLNGLTKYKTYYVKVAAVNSAGTSSYSAVKAILATDGLVAKYDFSGDNKDSGPFSANLAHTGNVVMTIDRFGNASSAVYFDGNYGNLSATASHLPNRERTLSAWVKLDDTTTTRTIFGYGGNGIYSTSQIMSWGTQTGRYGWLSSAMMAGYSNAHSLFSPSTGNPVGNWVHMITVIDQNGTRIYINNQLVASNTDFNTDTYVDGKKLFIGVEPFYDGVSPHLNPFKGAIDDIRIYNRALTAAERNALYAEGGYNPTPDVTGLTIQKVTGSTFTAVWNSITGNPQFEVQVAKDATFINKVSGYESYLTSQNTVKITGLAPYTDYFLRVRTKGYNIAGSFANAPVITTTDGIVAQYDFSGNGKDTGPFAKDLTVVGATLVPDRFGNPNSAFRFNESRNTYLVGDASDLPTAERAVSMWVKTEDAPSLTFLLTYGGTNYGSFQLAWGPGNPGRWEMKDYYTYWLLSQATESTIGKWIHLVSMTGKNGSKIFINGNLVASNAVFYNSTTVSGKKIMVGASLNSEGTAWEGNGFIGAIDDIKIYDRELTDAEILALATSSGTYNPTPDVTGLQISKLTGSTFTAVWNKAQDVDNYEYQVAKDINFNVLVPGFENVKTNTVSVQITGLKRSQDYYVRVRTLGYAQQGTYSSAVLAKTTNGLAAKYEFSGNAKDTGPNGKDLTVMAASLTADRFGNPNSAYYFNSSRTTYLIGDASELPAAERTVAMWVKPEEVASIAVMLTYGPGGNNFQFAWNYGTPGRWDVKDTWTYWLTKQATLQANGNWSFLVFTTGPTGSKLYINGVEEASNSTYYNNTKPAGKKICIGASLQSDGITWEGNGFVGTLDDVSLYDAELTPAEILAMYEEGNWVPAPETPVINAATNVTDKSFIANWNPVNTATGYYLDVSKDPNFLTFISGYQGYSAQSPGVSVSGLTELTTYYYRVRAYNLAGTSGYSQSVSLTTLQSPLVAPVALDAAAVQDNGFLAKWEPQTAPLQFQFEVATDLNFSTLIPGYNPRTIENTNSVSSLVVAGLQPETTYFYRLRGTRGSEVSDYSNVVQVKTKATPVAPSRPAVLSATAIDLHQFTANWMPADGATYYNLYVATDSLFTGLLPNWNPKNVTETSAVVNTLNAGRTYWYRVKAGNLVGLSAYSDSVKVETKFSAPVSQPSTLPTNGGFTANWLAVTNAAYYLLDVSKNAAFTEIVAGYENYRVNGTSSEVTGITVSGTYLYRVRAVSSFGVISSYSDAVSVSVTYNDIVAPVATAATNVHQDSFVANWNTVSGASLYEIRVSGDGFVNYSTQTSANNFVFISGLLALTDYEYKVRAKIAGVWSDFSNVIQVTTAGSLDSPVLAVSNIQTTSFDLTWTAITLATGYTIVVSENAGFTVIVDSLYSASTGLSVTGFTPDKTYYVKGYAVRGKYSSVASEVKTVKTLSGLPDAPVATEATNITENSYQANWNPVANAMSYEVQQSTNGFVSWVKQNATVTKATFTSLNPATTYKYRVNVTDINGKTSGYSNEITVVTQSSVLPGPVLNSPSSITQTGFTLIWQPVSGAVEYYVDVASENDFAPGKILADYNNKKVTGTSLVVSGLVQGMTYWARVRGFDAKNYGNYSNVVFASTLSQPLSTPVLNAASAITPTSFAVSWSDITGKTGYQLDVSLNSSFSPNISGYDKKDVALNSATVSGLSPGTLYYVRVRAVNTNTSTFSSYSSPVQVTTTIDSPVLLDPDQIQATSFRAKWNPVTNVGSYRLDVSKDLTFTQIISGYNDKVISSTETSLVVNGLTKKTLYFFRMRAVKGTFTTENSAIKTVTTDDVAVIPATALQATDTTSTGFIAHWQNPGTGYTVVLDVALDDLFASKVPGYNEKSVTGKAEEEVTGLNPFTTYYYRIKVTDATTSFAYSNTITVKTRVAKVSVNDPAKIKNDSFEISWSPVTGATNYVVLVSKNNLLVPQISGYPKTTANSPFTVTGLDEKTQYYFAVAAFNSDGTGDLSVLKSVTTSAIPSLATPVLNTPTNKTQTGFTISWNEVSGATGYRYDLALDNAFTQTVTGYVNAFTTSTSVSVTGREPNTTYYFRVKAVTETGEGDYAASGGIKTLPVLPGAPTVSAPSGELPTSFTANWQPVVGADSYQLDVSTDQNFTGGVWIFQNEPVNATQKLVTGLTPSTDYFYRVRAKNEAGTSGNSGTQKATTPSGKPAAPQLLPVTAITSTSATLEWSQPSGAVSYRLDLSENNAFSSFVIENRLVAGSTETVTSLSPGLTYYYRVRAENSFGASVNSATNSFVLIPGNPIAVDATNATSTSFQANWGAVTGATSYRFDLSTSELFSSFVPGYGNLSVTGTFTSVTGVSPNIPYYYRVRAVNNSGTSGNSNVVTLTLLPQAPGLSGLVLNPATAVLGMSDIEVKISVENSPTAVFLYFGSPTAPALTQVTMAPSGGQFVATISKNSYTKEGLVFRISAENERGKTWYPAETQVVSVPVNVPAQNIITEVLPTSSFPTGIEKETWNTLSLPFTGSVNLTTILGTQELSGGEPVNWAAYTFNGTFNSVTQMTGGQGYFLYHKSGDGANLIKNAVTAAGTIVTYDQNAFANTQLANGWNLVAWPYTYGAQLTIKDGTKVGSVWQMKSGSWEKNSSVKPFGGYAIYNKTGSGGLKVSDVLTWTTQSLSKSGSADLAQYEADWLVKLGVSSGTISDAWNYIGVSQNASVGFDLLDEKNPFSPEAGLDLFTTEQNGTEQVKLAASIKTSGSGLKIWTLTVANSTPGKQVKLNWEKLNVPEGVSLMLVDLTSKRKTDLSSLESGTVILSGEPESRLQVLAGSSAEIESAVQGLKSDLQANFALLANYPNPFNPSTLISIEMGRDEVLELAIYNSIGQKIKTLYSGFALAGKQQFEWNATDDAGNPVSSGIYFCTMKSGTFMKTNKMLLTR